MLRLVRLILKAGGKRGVPQGGVSSPLMSNLYLTEVDKMLERAKEVTRQGRFTYGEYARFADDLVIVIDGYRKWDWVAKAVSRRLLEEFASLDVRLNHDKTRWVNLAQGASFNFLGFAFRRVKTRQGVWGVLYAPTLKARTALLSKLRDVLGRFRSQPVDRLITLINPIPTRMGQLFSGGPRQSVFWLCERLGGEEGTATNDAVAPASGFRLEKVE